MTLHTFLSPIDFVEKYVINYKDIVAKGSHGVVYNAKCIKNEEYVVKVCAHMDDTIAEIDSTIRLQHPGIIKPIDFCLGEESFIVYPKGVLINDYLNTHLEDFKRLVIELIDILSYLYDQGIAHCDIKPSNIIVIDTHAVLIDFGLSNVCYCSCSGGRGGQKDKVFNRFVSYTDGFVPPEPNYGFRSITGDTFSMGKTIECLYMGIDQYLPNLPIRTDDPQLDDLLKRMVCPQETRMLPSELLLHPYTVSQLQQQEKSLYVVPVLLNKKYPDDINPRAHYVLVTWLLELCYNFKFSTQTAFLCMHNMARSVKVLHSFESKSFQAFGIVHVYLASLIHEPGELRLDEFIHLSLNAYTKSYLYDMLRIIMNELGGIVNVPTLWDHCISGNNIPALLKSTCLYEYPNTVVPEQTPSDLAEMESKFIQYTFFMIGTPTFKNGIHIFDFMDAAICADADASVDVDHACIRIVPQPIKILEKSTLEMLHFIDEQTRNTSMCKTFFNDRDNYALIYRLRFIMETDAIFANIVLSNVLQSVLIDSYDIVFGAKKLKNLAFLDVSNLSINCYTASTAEILECMNA
jgi:hypothetical protein